MKLFLAVFLVSFFVRSDAAIVEGPCADFDPLTEFDLPAYLGRWYEIKRFAALFEAGNSCVTADYGYLTETSITVVNSAITASGEMEDISGYAVATDVPGQIIVSFNREDEPEANYIVLGTDYVTYACVYSCGEIANSTQKSEVSWILSRTPELDDSTLAVAEETFSQWDIDISLFRATYQGENCTYAPEPEI